MLIGFFSPRVSVFPNPYSSDSFESLCLFKLYLFYLFLLSIKWTVKLFCSVEILIYRAVTVLLDASVGMQNSKHISIFVRTSVS